tara:strand:- start:12045 stop:12599 length:555 start_codon:yes stop_codon:yes gene_type:complete
MVDLSSIARVEGPNLILRLIEPNDAGYVHDLRTNPTYNRHLSKVRGTIEDQRRWIQEYKMRETEGQEFYYVIERKDGMRCGLVRLYEIGFKSFTWGSWILDFNKPRRAAFESAMLSFEVAFDRLNLLEGFVDVRIDNAKALAFYIRFGMRELRRDHQDVYFVYSREAHEQNSNEFQRYLEQEVS